MPYLDDDDDDANEDLDERELPDEADANEDQDTHPCPHCGKEIYDEAEQCPRCGKYVDVDPLSRKPIWFIVAVIVCTLIVLGWYFWGHL